MSIIAHPHTDSIQGRQLKAAIALTKILEHHLPAADWHISGVYAGTLDGQISKRRDDETRADLAEWATFFGATVEEDKPHSDRRSGDIFTTVEVTTTYREVPVRMWGHVNRTKADEQKAEATA
jgi:hypothetical protein